MIKVWMLTVQLFWIPSDGYVQEIQFYLREFDTKEQCLVAREAVARGRPAHNGNPGSLLHCKELVK